MAFVRSLFPHTLLIVTLLYSQYGGAEQSQEIRDPISDLQRDLREVSRHVLELQEHPLPVGFVYFEIYPNPPPTSLWPHVRWLEITSNYAGQFFRALGGGSGPIGSVQAENVPRITTVRQRQGLADGCSNCDSTLTPGSYSARMWTGDDGGTSMDRRRVVDLFTSSGEVRPRNQAIKIWQVISAE